MGLLGSENIKKSKHKQMNKYANLALLWIGVIFLALVAIVLWNMKHGVKI